MLGVKLDYNMSAWKKTLIAGLISYIDAGSIVAGASGLSMWAEYLGMSSVQMGLFGSTVLQYRWCSAWCSYWW